MPDNLSPEDRHRTMKAIKSRRTGPERRLHGLLAGRGISGWINTPIDLPGNPDFVFIKSKLAVFVDGCFWHGCKTCNKPMPKDNREYWQNKLSNKFREKRQTIESLHQIEINEQSQKNYPIFKKRLGIEKDVLAYIKVEKDFNDYSKNYEKRLEEKRENVRKFFSKIRDKLKSWAETRDAFNDVNIQGPER